MRRTCRYRRRLGDRVAIGWHRHRHGIGSAWLSMPGLFRRADFRNPACADRNFTIWRQNHPAGLEPAWWRRHGTFASSADRRAAERVNEIVATRDERAGHPPRHQEGRLRRHGIHGRPRDRAEYRATTMSSATARMSGSRRRPRSSCSAPRWISRRRTLRTGFTFRNPNQSSACGCGESVELKPADLKALAEARARAPDAHSTHMLRPLVPVGDRLLADRARSACRPCGCPARPSSPCISASMWTRCGGFGSSLSIAEAKGCTSSGQVGS